jgi:two-component system OmpR family sensor kinase
VVGRTHRADRYSGRFPRVRSREPDAIYNDLDRELRDSAIRVATAYAAAEGLAGIDTQTPILGASTRSNLAVLVVGSGEVLASSHTSRLIPPVDPGDVLARPAGPAYDAIVRIAPPYTTIEHGIGAFGLAVGLDGARWRAYALPIGRQGAAGEPAYVLTIASLRDIDESIATARRLVPLLALVGSLFILIARLVLANRALRPVAALTETAAGIARAHALGRRVPVGNRRDELGQMARTFNAMLDTIEQTYVAQQRFVADASHELRTPLTAVLANLDLLEHQPGLPSEEREEAVREASRETRRLVRLVSGLLSLARADAGATLLRDAVEFDRVVMEAVAEASRLEGPPNVDVDTLEPVCIDGERDQLKQLVIILLDNAVKFTPRDGQVVVSMLRRTDQLELRVRDTGIGIADEDLPRVFERFYRGSRAREHNMAGMGLGLSIARWITESHGGSIQLTSGQGEGTTASVVLPLAPAGDGDSLGSP